MRHKKDNMKKEQKNAPDLFAEVVQTGDEKQRHEVKLQRYAKAKQHQIGVAEYILQNEPTLSKELSALQGCSQFLVFRNWYTVDQFRLIGGCTCKKHLLCAMCALRRAAKTVREVEKKVLSVLADSPDLIPVLITTTVKNGESLDERYSHITRAKKKLLQNRRTAVKSRIKNKSVTRLIHGSFGSYEFKKGSGGHGWHPHSHEIALLDPSVMFQRVTKKGKDVDCPVEFEKALQAEWFEITGDSFMVDVRRLSMGDKPDSPNGLLKGICEASKYALKLNDIELEDQIHAYKVLRGRRLTFTYGCLWGIKVPDDLNDTVEEELKLLPYVDLIYSFYSGSYNLTDVTDTGDSFLPKSSGKEKKTVVNDRLAKSLRFAGDVQQYARKVRFEDSI